MASDFVQIDFFSVELEFFKGSKKTPTLLSKGGLRGPPIGATESDRP